MPHPNPHRCHSHLCLVPIRKHKKTEGGKVPMPHSPPTSCPTLTSCLSKSIAEGVEIKNYSHHHGNVLSFHMEGCEITLGTWRGCKKHRRKTGQSEPISNHHLPLGKPFSSQLFFHLFTEGPPSLSSPVCLPSEVPFPCLGGWGSVLPTPALEYPFLTATQTSWSARHIIFTMEKEETLY